MNNRYLKIFVCVLMVCCLLFSFTFNAFAAVPAIIGEMPGISGAISSIIAGLMGVQFSYDAISSGVLDEFYDYQSAIDQAIWVAKTENGKAYLNIGLDALRALGSASSNKIDALSIADYSSGTAYSAHVSQFNGYELFQDGNYIRSNSLGPSVTLPGKASWQVGTTYIVSASNTFDGTCHITRTDNNYIRFEYYYQNELCGIRDQYPISFDPLTLVLRYYEFDYPGPHKVYLATAKPSINYDFTRSTNYIGSTISVNESIDYTSQAVDTSILNNLPSTAGLQISIPATGLESTEQLAQMVVDGVLSGSADITGTIVQDAGKPVVYDQSISDTPYNVLDGALDNIRSGIGSIAGSVTGTITSSLTGIQEAVNSIAGTIEAADAGFVQSFINGFLNVFQSAFDGVSSHLGIWHYVVSWIGSISSCFSWCLSAVSYAGSIFMVPIYATFAGSVVIAVYRRFGK